MRQRGRRIESYGLERPQGVTGTLGMYSMTTGEQGYTAATLRASKPKDPDVLPPLYEPALVTITGNGLMLRGFESIDGASFVQEWRVEFE